MRKADDWVIERWMTDRGRRGLELLVAPGDPAPPLWKDLTVASAIAVLLWGAAMSVFG